MTEPSSAAAGPTGRRPVPGVVRHASRYVVVGIVNTVVYVGLYWVLRLAVPYLVAHFVALAAAVVCSFFLNTYWTFGSRPTWRKFAAFPLSTLPNLLATTIGVVLLIEWLAVDERAAPVIAAGLALPLSFALSRWILIDRRPPLAGEPDRRHG